MAAPIPAFYRIWFTNVDPVLTTIGVFANMLSPDTILRGITPYYNRSPARETRSLLIQAAGIYAMILTQELYLLFAKPKDVGVWKAIEGSTALVDVGILAGIGYILSLEDRMALGSWRSEEWVNVSITLGALIIRIAFLSGVGMGRGVKGRMTKKV